MGLFTNWFKKKEPAQETRGLFCDSFIAKSRVSQKHT